MGRGVRLVVVMAANDLRRRLRDRSAVITAFVAPFSLAAIISLALGAGEGGLEAEIGVVDADRSEVSRALAGGLLDGRGPDGRAPRKGSIRYVPVPSEERAEARIDDAEVVAAIVFPPGFGRALTTPRPEPVRVVRDADRTVTGEVAAAIAHGLAARLDVTNLSVALVAVSAGAPPAASAWPSSAPGLGAWSCRSRLWSAG
jgi:ABC-2 type transport system permease protein